MKWKHQVRCKNDFNFPPGTFTFHNNKFNLWWSNPSECVIFCMFLRLVTTQTMVTRSGAVFRASVDGVPNSFWERAAVIAYGGTQDPPRLSCISSSLSVCLFRSSSWKRVSLSMDFCPVVSFHYQYFQYHTYFIHNEVFTNEICE